LHSIKPHYVACQIEAYKDVAQVVDVLHEAGIAERVARMRPIGVIKG